VKVVSVDNRAHAEPPWGFIHFDDRNSAAFAVAKDSSWEVGEGGPNWPTATTQAHLDAALAHLQRYGPKMPENTTS
jgi:hypothetical protein